MVDTGRCRMRVHSAGAGIQAYACATVPVRAMSVVAGAIEVEHKRVSRDGLVQEPQLQIGLVVKSVEQSLEIIIEPALPGVFLHVTGILVWLARPCHCERFCCDGKEGVLAASTVGLQKRL